MRNKLKYSRTTVLMVVILVLSTMSLFAQTYQSEKQDERPQQRSHKNNAENVDERVEMLTKELSLTADQVVQITELLNEHFEEEKALHEGDSKDRGAQRNKMQKLRKKLEDKILTILDKDQQEKFVELSKQDRPEREKRGK